MHIVENIIPMLVDLWTGSFKGLDDGLESYMLSPSVADAIGEACKKSGATIPSSFGARVPDIINERYQCTAESWFLFTTFLAPVLLHNRFEKRCYYDHFVELVVLINKCMQFTITSAEIDEIEIGFARWVQKYERFYYQYDSHRLATCTMPIHALLHIANDIRQIGPMWCFWAFVMERFCGSLLTAVKSRKHPFTSLAHRIRDVAQLSQIELLQTLDTLFLAVSKSRRCSRFVDNIVLDPDIRMLYPNRQLDVNSPLRNKIAAFLVTNYEVTRAEALKCIPDKISVWGKMKRLGGGDLIHAWDLIARYHTSPETARDATFVKFVLKVDTNAHRANLPVELRNETFFGQIRTFLILPLQDSFPVTHDGAEVQLEDAEPRTLILAAISQAKLTRQNAVGMPYFDAPSSDLGNVTEVIAANSIICLAGRINVQARNRWACLVRPDVAAKFQLVENSVLAVEHDVD
ncbi:hypothetical protein C8J57DRAFT_1068624 [Mycena rebaudengoi]|nr:hypothetical protein C8J57DRAFT_1068624 [Mycena rebaudengoi]